MRVHHLSCGSMCPFGGGLVDGRSGWGASSLICHVLLVETPSSGLVLVDTGFGLDDIANPSERLGGAFVNVARPRLEASETAAQTIEALGHSIDDVQHIVLTHMDLDHAGALSDFPNAAVHVFGEEHDAAVDKPTFEERQRYRSIQWAHGPRFETYDVQGEAWFGFRAVRELRGLPPEILMVPLRGHSRGHCGVVVESDRGTLLHAGDAYFHEQQMNVERPSCPAGLTFFQWLVAFDNKALVHNQRRLRDLVEAHGESVSVFSAHDEAELERLRADAAS